MVFQTLNRLKWKGGIERSSVTFVSRGSPGDRKTIDGKEITEIKKDHFLFREEGKETFIPNHRVLEIRKDGRLAWKRKTGKG